MDKDKVKENLKKAGNVILAIIGCLFFGFTSWLIEFLKDEKKDNEINELKAEIKKEEIKHEIKEKTSDDIIADAPDPQSISDGIQQQQNEFRNRVFNRLEQVLHSSGGERDN